MIGELKGTVERIENHYAYVACPRAPRHLQTITIRIGWDCPPDTKVGEELLMTYVKYRWMAIWTGRRG